MAAHPLEAVVASAVAVPDDGRAIVHARYQDAASATADLAARRAGLAGNSVLLKRPYAKDFAVTLAARGSDLVYDLILHGGAGQLRSLVEQHDAPWVFC
ncbi:hypothetical protein ABIB25_004397 [Nakamurella sp. UYEF19]|uniref:hypothetical protein n=1 Tax=Nakamurella sp. UYEF19 TaxID=1756392 RepID=UPI003396F88D